MTGRLSSSEIAREQAYLTMLYQRLDGARALAEQRLAEVLREPAETPQARSEREAVAARYEEQLTRLRAAEQGLCFGRLDLDDGERRYIGRLGMFDESDDYAPLLIDWRAPAARPFYAATAAAREGVRRRRHLRTRDRCVLDLQDEVLDLAAGGTEATGGSGETALLAALNAGRTGRMGDIVATIQAEQDRAIRADHDGVLVVEGGPGTGKTAVALHRAAYLLYLRRDELASRGVLVVGPNPTFLRYIDQVLPSLGETGVVLSTVGQLVPGVDASTTEPAEVAEVKGRPELAEMIAAAVRDRQELPESAREIVLSDTHPGLGYQRTTVVLERSVCARAQARARRTGRPHNQARAVFVREVLHALGRQLADRLGEDPYADDPLGGDDAPGAGVSLLGEADVADFAAELRTDPAVQAVLAELWPRLRPQQLLADLFGSAQRLAAAAARLSEAERTLLRRDPSAGWTPADVPLLDEAAELLGQDEPDPVPAQQRRREQLDYAQGVLDIAAGSRPVDDASEDDDPAAAVAELVTADQLAARQETRDRRTAAERAVADRDWKFGHVIVDEAQELSAMAWRVLMRRCPSRSMTLVGDPAQTGDPAGVRSWQEALAPYVGQRWRRERLTVNYRTPAEIMSVAADVAAQLDPPPWLPRSVRRTGVVPWRRRVAAAELAGQLPDIVAAEAAEVTDGRLAVIVPAGQLDELGRAVVAALPDAATGPDPDALDAAVVVLAVRSAKGLEFDSVVVVEPHRILAGSPRGGNDLYVALTRPTRRLGVVHTGELPGMLARLDSPG